MLENKRVIILGATGSLGTTLLSTILSNKYGSPKTVIVFSRDEAKQHSLQQDIKDKRVEYIIGDIRDYGSVVRALQQDIDIVFNVAALKHVPSSELHPFEAVLTNIVGAENIIRAIKEYKIPIETVVGISTDKACKPVNVMGMTKAIQERLFINANKDVPTRFVLVRYGNVINSRGSVIPLFLKQIKEGNPLTITNGEMTRFLMTLDQAVEIIFTAIENGVGSEIFIPIVPSSTVLDLAKAIGGNHKIIITGIRPGEKLHEILISEEEIIRTTKPGNYYVIHPEIQEHPALTTEYSSKDFLIGVEELKEILRKECLIS